MTVASLWRSPWPALWLAVGYCTLATRDVELGPVPGKFIVTVLALLVWFAHSRRPAPEWRAPLVAMALVFPLFGLIVAGVRELSGDPAQQLGLRSAAEEASRFAYVLLALPLADWAESRGEPEDAHRVWLWPAIALAVLTCALYLIHLLGVEFGGSGRVGPLQGDIGVDPVTQWFRAFMITNILFIPAMVLVFARLHESRLRPSSFMLLAVLAGAVVLSHTRGIWLGLVIACAVCLVLRLVLVWPAARPALAVAGASLALLLVGLAVPTLADSLFGRNTDQSSSVRLQQTPELLAGFERHPVIGSGLGAVLPSGYRRSDDTPWSFELAYLQLLFQGGIVGMALLAWLPVSIIRRTVGRLLTGNVHADGRASAIAGVATLAGLLVTYATNPYLVTSAGTLALAISVSLCHAARP